MQIWTRWSAALAASTALAAFSGAAHAQSAAGDWHGTMTFNGNANPVGVTLKAKAGGGYEGSYTTRRGVDPVVDAKVDKGTLSFSVASGGSYSGRWDEARKAWVGHWTPKFQMSFIPASPGAAPASPPPGPPPGLPPFPPLELMLTAGKP